METFLSIHQDAILGTLSTFDRMIFKGHLTSFFPEGAFARFGSQERGFQDTAQGAGLWLERRRRRAARRGQAYAGEMARQRRQRRNLDHAGELEEESPASNGCQVDREMEKTTVIARPPAATKGADPRIFTNEHE